MCSHIVCPHAHHAQACACTQNSESTRVIAVTALDVCGTLLRNLTLALSKARLNAAIHSTTLSFPSYILLVPVYRQATFLHKLFPIWCSGAFHPQGIGGIQSPPWRRKESKSTAHLASLLMEPIVDHFRL